MSERILVPVSVQNVKGVNGSLWETKDLIRNDSSVEVGITPTSPGFRIAPLSTVNGFLSVRFDHSDVPGTIFWLGYPEGFDKANLHFNLRVQDVSRQAQTWGTEIPVVRESELSTRKIVLLGIPTDSRFRQALRIYETDLRGAGVARLRMFELDGKTPLVDINVALPSASGSEFEPGFAQYLWLTRDFPQLLSTTLLRIEIEPVSPGMRFWAFVSVTNNETQHVTVITPH
ncbi:MAG TPA: hypothetical protein VER58_12375 [Thermoanaerobaculia bacterium]|nr:hypothetical protein [Thermoanaerobaculia bacterium]